MALVAGNPVFTPNPGYNGPASFTYTVSDGNGGYTTATVSISVIAKPIEPGSPTLPAEPPLPPVTISPLAGPSSEPIRVDGFVLDAIQGVQGLDGIANQIGERGIILDVVNHINGLNGSDFGEGGVVGVAASDLEPQRLSEIWGAAGGMLRALDRALNGGVPEGLSGFSLRMSLVEPGLEDSSTRSQIIVESLVRDGILILRFSNSGNADGKIIDYRVMQANGAPLPNWLERAGDDLLIGRRPADTDQITLKIIVIYVDGTSEEKSVAVSSASGEIRPIAGPRSVEVPTFADQFPRYEHGLEQGRDGLADVLGR